MRVSQVFAMGGGGEEPHCYGGEFHYYYGYYDRFRYDRGFHNNGNGYNFCYYNGGLRNESASGGRGFDAVLG